MKTRNDDGARCKVRGFLQSSVSWPILIAFISKMLGSTGSDRKEGQRSRRRMRGIYSFRNADSAETDCGAHAEGSEECEQTLGAELSRNRLLLEVSGL